MGNKISNCPFCGGIAEEATAESSATIYDEGWAAKIMCHECGASSREVTSASEQDAIDKAIGAWNTRTTVDNAELIERLEAMLENLEFLKRCTTQPAVPDTPAAKWRVEGEPDPFPEYSDKRRSDLCMGHLTDDELANEVFMYNHRTGLESMPRLTAAKERIRWLSRQVANSPQTNESAAIILCDANAQFCELFSDFGLAKKQAFAYTENDAYQGNYNAFEIYIVMED